MSGGGITNIRLTVGWRMKLRAASIFAGWYYVKRHVV